MKNKILLYGVTLAGVSLVGFLTWLDHRTQGAMSIYLLFFPTIMMVAWFGGRSAGIALSLLCVGAWAFSYREVLLALPVWVQTASIAIHIFALSFVAWMTVALGQAKVRRDYILKTQGEKLNIEMDLARRDHLTGALNSRGFQEKFSEERAKTFRYGRTTSLLHLDLDHFKDINDLHGHQFGDQMLKRVVAIMKENVRDVDSVARTGGDEFVVLLPETESTRAEICAVRILNEMKRSLRGPLTGSIGIVSFGQVPQSNTEISKMADDAMYQAKSLGRDRVVMKDLGIEDIGTVAIIRN